MYYPAPNITGFSGLLTYVDNVTVVGYGTASPFPIMGLLGEFTLFLLIFMGLKKFNYPTTHCFAAGSGVLAVVSVLGYALGVLPELGVIIPIIMMIASIFIVKYRE